MSIPHIHSRERSQRQWSHRVQVLFTVGIILLAGDSLLNLTQVTRGKELAVLIVCWEALKWSLAGALSISIIHEFVRSLSARQGSVESAAAVNSGRSAKIDRLYAELRPLMSRAASDPSLKVEVENRLSLLRKLQGEEADEMEKLFESRLLLKPGEGWEALHRAEALLARYEDPASRNSPASHHR